MFKIKRAERTIIFGSEPTSRKVYGITVNQEMNLGKV